MPGERKHELWDRWRAGESISQISVALAKPPCSVFTKQLRAENSCESKTIFAERSKRN